jgi:hypothetical protein
MSHIVRARSAPPFGRAVRRQVFTRARCRAWPILNASSAVRPPDGDAMAAFARRPAPRALAFADGLWVGDGSTDVRHPRIGSPGAGPGRGKPEDGEPLGHGPLRRALERLGREGSPLTKGAAGAVRVLLGQEAPEAFGERLGSWVRAAAAPGATAPPAGRQRRAAGPGGGAGRRGLRASGARSGSRLREARTRKTSGGSRMLRRTYELALAPRASRSSVRCPRSRHRAPT